VPKKLLVNGAHFAEDLADARRFGWDVPTCHFDWVRLRDNVMAEVARIEGFYGETLANNNVTVFHERATVSGPTSVTLASGEVIEAGQDPDRHRVLARSARLSGCRAWHHVQRGVPPAAVPRAC
jgi:glutathione reductase (NADPH)